MGYDFTGELRLTHKYSGGWADLEEHREVGLFRVLNTRDNGGDDRYGESYDFCVTVRAPRGASVKDVRQVLQNQFTDGCRCEHDCCGHFQHRVREVKHAKRRTWHVLVRAYANV